jgi:6,7-dimethyl-8-ribityllumazine synthase
LVSFVVIVFLVVAAVRTIEGTASAAGFRFALVVSKYNDFVTDRLQSGAVAALTAAGAADITIVRVPGAFEIPIAAQRSAQTGRFDAVICLGCVVRGDTPHFEYIASAVSHGITSAAASSGVPMTFGVLTTNSIEEAIERAGEGPANKGWEAATAAIEMVAIVAQLTSRHVAATGQ